MLLNSYLPITVIVLIAVQTVVVFGYIYNPKIDSSQSNIKEEIQRLLRQVDREKQNEEKIFANIYEKPETTERTEHDSKNLSELKLMLTDLLNKVDSMEKNKKRNDELFSTATTATKKPPTVATKLNTKSLRLLRDKKKSRSSEQKWGPWTDWSACSVSCGKGRKIRWRHCNQDCKDAETEMEEKACQLPACGPGKLFGVIPI